MPSSARVRHLMSIKLPVVLPHPTNKKFKRTRPPLVSSIKEHITKLGLDIRASTMSAWRLGPQQVSAKRPAVEDGELSPQT